MPIVTLAIALLLAQASPSPTDAVFVEDMPDPHGESWEPPPAPAPEPPPEPPHESRATSPVLPSPSTSTVSGLPSSVPMQPIPPPAATHGQRLQVAGVIFGVSGAIVLAVGGYLHDAANKTQTKLDTTRQLQELGATTRYDVETLEERRERQRMGSTVSLIAGGSSLALGVILFLAGSLGKRQAKGFTVSISADRAFAGLTLGGRF